MQTISIISYRSSTERIQKENEGFTSAVSFTGPLSIPIQTLISEWFRNAVATSSAHCAGASGLLRKTSTILSPVGNLTSVPSETGAVELFRTLHDLVQLERKLRLLIDDEF